MTGAAGGLGRATVALLRDRGFAIFATDLALAAIPCGDPGFLAESLDVTDEAAIAARVGQAEAAFGRIDHVVHLAGRAGQGPIDAVSRADWQSVLDVNLTSAFLLAKATHRALASSRGTLTLVSSTNGLNGGSTLSGPAYAVAKAGLIMLTKSLARELGPHIRVNAIAPGPVMWPADGVADAELQKKIVERTLLKRSGSAQDIARTALFFAADAPYVTGQVLAVDGGRSVGW